MKIEFTDTHAHLYLDAFQDDREELIERAIRDGITRIMLPNIDSSTLNDLRSLHNKFPENCFPMIGLHPTSVKENYLDELTIVQKGIQDSSYIAIGEIGIDLYWDKTFLREQQDAFRKQLRWAKEKDLPVVIHARDSFDEIFEIMDEENDAGLNGVFHSFTGNKEEVEKILEYGFYIGINGIVTFKNSGLDKVVENIPLEYLLLETDAPFLAPVPFRGKRNESSYVKHVALKISEIFEKEMEEIAVITTRNALELFKRVK